MLLQVFLTAVVLIIGLNRLMFRDMQATFRTGDDGLNLSGLFFLFE